MPPRPSSYTGSFPATDNDNEVVCPLRNNDGSKCHKKCTGEKRYRSIQEHIRRAHAQYYIPKKSATKQSFELMVNSKPSEKQTTQAAPPPRPPGNTAYGHGGDNLEIEQSLGDPSRPEEDLYPAAQTAAVALAQMPYGTNSDFDSDIDYGSDHEPSRRWHPSVELSPPENSNARRTVELPPPNDHSAQYQMHPFHSPRPRELLPSMMAHSPAERSSMPPIPRHESQYRRDNGIGSRPRKSSITLNNNKPKPVKREARVEPRQTIGGRPILLDAREGRQAFSAEPPRHSRWDDLVEAASAAPEMESDRELTPMPVSPSSIKRSSMPPFAASVTHNQSYKASPLGQALTPPPSHTLTDPPPFQPAEASATTFDGRTSMHSAHTSASGQNFHIPSSGLSSSESATSPTFYNSQHLSSNSQSSTNGAASVQIICFRCHRYSVLSESFACTNCIRGFCGDCLYLLNSDHSGNSLAAGTLRLSSGRPCPGCNTLGGSYKPFRLDIR